MGDGARMVIGGNWIIVCLCGHVHMEVYVHVRLVPATVSFEVDQLRIRLETCDNHSYSGTDGLLITNVSSPDRCWLVSCSLFRSWLTLCCVNSS